MHFSSLLLKARAIIIAILTVLTIVILSTSCSKNVSDYNIADINHGHLLYTYKLVSYQDPTGIYYANAIGKLDDDYFRFFPDGHAIRYQGKQIFFDGTPQVIRFTFAMDRTTGKYSSLNMGGNEVTIDAGGDQMTIIEIPDPKNPRQQFRVYKLIRVSDGVGMDGNE